MAAFRAGSERREEGIWDFMKRFGWGFGLGFEFGLEGSERAVAEPAAEGGSLLVGSIFEVDGRSLPTLGFRGMWRWVRINNNKKVNSSRQSQRG